MATTGQSTKLRLFWPAMRIQPHWLRRVIILFCICLLLLLLPFAWRRWVQSHYAEQTYRLENVPAAHVAIVFGARVYGNGRLSTMVRDRVDTAIALYKAGKVQKLLFSGDNRFASYDEPGDMMTYALAHGVPATVMQPDYGGRRTYDTCYRAQAIFHVEAAVLITQSFHLPRALFLCDQLGIKAVGVAADLHPYSWRALTWSESRELPALLAALVDLLRRAPPPVMGQPIPIH